MPDKKSKKYYAVKKGHCPGIYPTWEEAKKQITGYSGPIYKKFTILTEAQQFMDKRNYQQKIKEQQQLQSKVKDTIKYKFDNLDVNKFILTDNYELKILENNRYLREFFQPKISYCFSSGDDRKKP